jgi:hypothetical protein
MAILKSGVKQGRKNSSNDYLHALVFECFLLMMIVIVVVIVIAVALVQSFSTSNQQTSGVIALVDQDLCQPLWMLA